MFGAFNLNYGDKYQTQVNVWIANPYDKEQGFIMKDNCGFLALDKYGFSYFVVMRPKDSKLVMTTKRELQTIKSSL